MDMDRTGIWRLLMLIGIAVTACSAASCNEGAKYPHPNSCRMYYTCTSGNLNIKLCPLMEVFEVATGQCKFGVSCGKTECLGSETRAVESCSSYEKCVGGKWERENCPGTTKYNPLSGSCMEGSCKQCIHNQLSIGSTSSRYQICQRGIWVEKKCPLYQRFDKNRKVCVWAFDRTPSDDNKSSVLACNQGATRAEDDCSTYSLCDKGKWILQECPENYLFDSEKLECVPENDAACLSCPRNMAAVESCSAYYKCSKGVKTLTACGFMKKWDGVTRKCVYSGAHCFPGDRCNTEGIRRETEDCKLYEECLSGRFYKKACGFSQIYDGDSSECVWANPFGSCSEKNVVRECLEGDSKPLDCHNYVDCVGGKWTQKKCAEGETYRAGRCVRGDCRVSKLSCKEYTVNGALMACDEGEVFDEERWQCVVGTCGRQVRSAPQCIEGAKEEMAEDCRGYRVCIKGSWVEAYCSDCMNYDPASKTCRYVVSYPCKRVVTPQPKTTVKPEPTQPKTTPGPDPTQPKTTPEPEPTQPKTTPEPEPTQPKTTEDPQPTQPKTTPEPQPTQPKTTPEPQPTQPKTTEPPEPTQPKTTPAPEPTQPPTTPQPLCEEGSKKPNKENCRKYFVCKGGQYVEDACVWPRDFDSVTLSCVWSGAKCA